MAVKGLNCFLHSCKHFPLNFLREKFGKEVEKAQVEFDAISEQVKGVNDKMEALEGQKKEQAKKHKHIYK